MNTPVNFPTAKLLKEKSWNTPTLNFYFEDGESKENILKETTGMDYGSEFTIEFSELLENWNDKWLTKKNGNRCFGCSKSKGYFETFSAPTITEVVMWLYEKHDIWIYIQPQSLIGLNKDREADNWYYTIIHCDRVNSNYYKSPTEAYEAAIKFVLENLL